MSIGRPERADLNPVNIITTLLVAGVIDPREFQVVLREIRAGLVAVAEDGDCSIFGGRALLNGALLLALGAGVVTQSGCKSSPKFANGLNCGNNKQENLPISSTEIDVTFEGIKDGKYQFSGSGLFFDLRNEQFSVSDVEGERCIILDFDGNGLNFVFHLGDRELSPGQVIKFKLGFSLFLGPPHRSVLVSNLRCTIDTDFSANLCSMVSSVGQETYEGEEHFVINFGDSKMVSLESIKDFEDDKTVMGTFFPADIFLKIKEKKMGEGKTKVEEVSPLPQPSMVEVPVAQAKPENCPEGADEISPIGNLDVNGRPITSVEGIKKTFEIRGWVVEKCFNKAGGFGYKVTVGGQRDIVIKSLRDFQEQLNKGGQN